MENVVAVISSPKNKNNAIMKVENDANANASIILFLVPYTAIAIITNIVIKNRLKNQLLVMVSVYVNISPNPFEKFMSCGFGYAILRTRTKNPPNS